ncbi:MAG: hypothetical protein ACRC80_19835 [Waterburya sp.]
MVAIDFPPPASQVNISPVLKTLDRGVIIRRIYDPTKYNTQAISFRNYCPRLLSIVQ